MLDSGFRRVRGFFSVLASAACLLASCSAREPYPDLLSIGTVQGKVPPAGDASRFRSRFHGETVTVRGVLTQVLRWKTGEGEDAYGVFLQNGPEDRDGDPDTSDGIFVFTGGQPILPLRPQGQYRARVGDVLTVRGEVNERYGQTELSEATVLDVRPVGDLEKAVPPVDLVLPASDSERMRLLEKLEGMRVRLAPGAVAVTGTHPHGRMGDMQIWVAPGTHPMLERPDPATHRLFRPYHPLSTEEPELKENAFGRRLLIGSLGIKARLEDDSLFLPALYAGSRFAGPLVGSVQYSWGEYILQLETLPEIRPAEPAPAALPPKSAAGLRIAAYNVENLYDFLNDPFDDCDFEGDPGCRGTRFPLNYVPENDRVYRARLRKIAEQIVQRLESPDILMIQEVEDQDIGRLREGGMEYGAENNADGELDALQELAIQIVALGGPVYNIAVDRDGTDDRGIICAWMYQDDRLRKADPSAGLPLLGADPKLPGEWRWFDDTAESRNPKAFNAVYEGAPDNEPGLVGVFSRAVQVLALNDLKTGGRIWLLNNHFSSGPDRRVERRTQQAAVNADLATHILKSDPGAMVVVGGDLNVFPRPDDPLDPPADQLGPLYRAGLYNVVDRVMAATPERAYSYIYRGVPNVLDHFFLSPAARERLVFADYLKLNASAPEAFSGQPPLRASDHDPLMIELRMGD